MTGTSGSETEPSNHDLAQQRLYSYRKLEGKNDLRLVTILPGRFDDDIVINITHAPLLASQHSRRPKATLQELKATLPAYWEVKQTLNYRCIFQYEDPDGNEGISWSHPHMAIDETIYQRLDGDQVPYEPRYEALSYTWGSIIGTDTAYVEDQDVLGVSSSQSGSSLYTRLPIGENLACAMRHLRYSDRERVVWIDAICINQSDISERDKQVARMTDIYKLANRVVVWLGPSSETSGAALKTIDYLGRQVVPTLDNWHLSAPGATEPDWVYGRTRLPFDYQTWMELYELFLRGWFERMWILQEVQLAEDAVVCCGHDAVSWVEFSSAFRTIWNQQKLPGFIARERLALIERLVTRINFDSPIANSFMYANGRLCKDPRDLIYGFLGLLPENFRHKIHPRYTIPISQVYTETVLAHIQHVGRLEMFRSCYLENRQVDCPTWVPDFSAPAVVARQVVWQFAAGYSRCKAGLVEPNVLEVAGVHCATVCEIVTSFTSDRSNVRSRLEAVRDMEPRDLETADPYITGESFKSAYARTLIGNYLKERFPVQNGPDLESWSAQDSPNALFGEHAKSPVPQDLLLTWHEEHSLGLVQGRPFMITEEGYIALGPPGGQVGDIICVFLGCDAPILLRPALDNHYTVVGECFVHGLNDTIALLGPLPEGWRVQVFDDFTGHLGTYRYYNTATGSLSDEDPRLEALQDWVRVDCRRTGDDPAVFQCFKNKATGEVIKYDPRMDPEALMGRGVEVISFLLV